MFVTKKKAISSICNDYNTMFKDDFELTVINYESLHKIADRTFDLVIIDEAHSLGQFPVPSDRTKLLKQICWNTPIIYLSGTPTPESYSQLFHQFWVSSFSPFGHSNFYQWVKMGYVNVKNKYIFNRTIPDYSDANKKMIDEKTKHLFLSYTQEQAGFTELVDEEVHLVSMQPGTYTFAQKLKRDRVVMSKNDVNQILADTEVKLMQKFHQLFSGTVLAENNNVPIVFDYSKAYYIFDTFKGQKIAIYYKFRGEKELICTIAESKSIKITESPDKFNRNDDLVFISQIQSGREGVNLSTADCLIMFNIDFAAVSYWQARARIQSMERDKATKVHWIFAKGGIEEKIYETVKNKKDYTLSYFKKDQKL